MKLFVGHSLKASALLNGNLSALPDGASARWESSDPHIATVSQDPANPLTASVAGVSAGTVTVTCIVTDHTSSAKEISGHATQIVEPAPAPITSVDVTVG